MNAITKTNGNGAALDPAIISSLVIGGDLGGLTNEQRVSYYKYRCQQVGLDPSAKPFDLLKLNGKMVLYANASCTQQLCQIHGLSPTITDRALVNGIYCVTSRVTGEGRTTENLGAVPVEGLKGDNLANAMMKAVTKAHRRTILAHVGLGMLDETEVETIPNAQPQGRGNPIKAEADRLADEIEACGDRDMLNAFMETNDVKDFLARAANAKGALNYADVTLERYWQHHDKLPETKTNKRAFIKSTSDYDGTPAVEAPPVSSPNEAPVPPAAGPTFSVIAEKCLEQFDIVDDVDAFKRAQQFATEHQKELTPDEKKALNELSRRVGARLREAA